MVIYWFDQEFLCDMTFSFNSKNVSVSSTVVKVDFVPVSVSALKVFLSEQLNRILAGINVDPKTTCEQAQINGGFWPDRGRKCMDEKMKRIFNAT